MTTSSCLPVMHMFRPFLVQESFACLSSKLKHRLLPLLQSSFLLGHRGQKDPPSELKVSTSCTNFLSPFMLWTVTRTAKNIHKKILHHNASKAS